MTTPSREEPWEPYHKAVEVAYELDVPIEEVWSWAEAGCRCRPMFNKYVDKETGKVNPKWAAFRYSDIEEWLRAQELEQEQERQ